MVCDLYNFTYTQSQCVWLQMDPHKKGQNSVGRHATKKTHLYGQVKIIQKPKAGLHRTCFYYGTCKVHCTFSTLCMVLTHNCRVSSWARINMEKFSGITTMHPSPVDCMQQVCKRKPYQLLRAEACCNQILMTTGLHMH